MSIKRLTRLQDLARKQIEEQGHQLHPFHQLDDKHSRTRCTKCGRDVYCTLDPAPNEIAVAGGAVMDRCPAK